MTYFIQIRKLIHFLKLLTNIINEFMSLYTVKVIKNANNLTQTMFY